MADTNKKLVSLDLLTYYDSKVTVREDTKDTTVLNTAKGYTDTKIGDVTTAADALAERVTAVETKAGTNETAIGVLNGDETTDGSVKKTVADAVAKIVADAPDSFDTLKEISDWISTHSESASAMNTAIQNNSKAITALQTLIGTLPEGITAKDVVGYIAEAVKVETDRATGVEGVLDTRLKTVESAVGDADTGILATAKAYTDAEVVKVNASIKTNTDAIATINDPKTGAIATAETYTDTKIAALSQTGGAIKAVSDELSGYKTATDARLEKVEAATGSFATNEDIDSIFANI